MNPRNPRDRSPCCASGACDGPTRREFLKLAGVGAAAMAGMPAMAGPFQASDFERLVPADKKLSPEWIASLFSRGTCTVYRGAELEKIGMPVGGICTGQVYLGGDGRLWHWDIFNAQVRTGSEHYARPLRPESPLEQGFALRVFAEGNSMVRRLDRTGFADVSFCGEYPIGTVEYRDESLPVVVRLEAFSPFIPLNPDDSGLPAIVLEFTLKNTSSEPVEAELAGWLENAVCLKSRDAFSGRRVNQAVHQQEIRVLDFYVEPTGDPQDAERRPIVFAAFDEETYGNWGVDGTAFGAAPARGAPSRVQKLSGFVGQGLANSWPRSDKPTGKLTSPSFTIERPFISFLIAGGNHPGETSINLIVDERVVRTSTGKNTDALAWENWNVRDLMGKTARIEIVDNHSGGWGHIDIDQIEFRDRPRSVSGKLEEQPDFGSMVLALLKPEGGDVVRLAVPAGIRPEDLFAALPSPPTPLPQAGEGSSETAEALPLGQRCCGAIVRKLTIEPGQEAKATFLIAWHFPNLRMDRLPPGRHYATRFKSAREVAQYLASHFDSIEEQTRRWHATWYDSTLPHWFLDRTFANTSILATNTCYWFGNGRFYGWEGVGCCPGTCAHVWQYAHAAARLFPQLERSVREMADYGVSFDPASGAIRFRGEFNEKTAVDGQAGCVLRAYREHQMSADDGFLRRNWAKIRKSLEYLMVEDGNGDGILQGAQHNTLDAEWYGPVAWLSGLYLAALRAGEAMALEMGDAAFAAKARRTYEAGARKLPELLFNGEYFMNRPDPNHPEAINSGSGCEIDQVFGQSWAFQIGLGRVLPRDKTLAALRALWKYNFTPDVGPYRQANPPGRWYAMPGEAGLLMCTFPRSDWNFEKARGSGRQSGFAGYFNECMNGFEYQVAGHMLWEGMLQEGMAIARAVHDRYHASRRNPWNEVECGDHYARSMASYGVFLAACGYEYHGPKGHLAFAPRLAPDDFRAAFTTAEGWGTFSQKRHGQTQHATIAVKWGKLRLKSLGFTIADNHRPSQVSVTRAGRPITATHTVDRVRVTITLEADVILDAGQSLEVAIA